MWGFFHSTRRLEKVLFIAAFLLPWTGFCGSADFTPKHIPLSPQLSHPHNGWVPYIPFVLMLLVALFFWLEFRRPTH